MSTPETPSRNRNRERFLFDEIESYFPSEDNCILAGEGLICFDASTLNNEDENQVTERNTNEPVDYDGDGVEHPTADVIVTHDEIDLGEEFDDNRASEDFGSAKGASTSSVDPPFNQQANTLQSMVGGVMSSFPELNFVMATGGERPLLQISQQQLYNHPPFGMVSRVQITVQYNYYTAYVLMRKWESGTLTSIEDLTMVCLKFSSKSEHKFCPGINPEDYETEYFAAIRFHIASVRRMEFPFARVDSVNCLLWFRLARNAKAIEKASIEVRCGPCKRLITDLEWQKRNTTSESPSRKRKRQNASSRARLSFMSPASQLKRRQNAQSARNTLTRKLANYEENEITLNEEQHNEMCAIVERTENDDLEKLLKEGNEHGVGNLMKEIWFTDKKRQAQQFANDQAANGKY